MKIQLASVISLGVAMVAVASPAVAGVGPVEGEVVAADAATQRGGPDGPGSALVVSDQVQLPAGDRIVGATDGVSTVGMSMLMDYSSLFPTPAIREAVTRIIGARLSDYGIDPTNTMIHHSLGGGNMLSPAGGDVVLPVVSAHRDVADTAGSGASGNVLTSSIRERAAVPAEATPIVQSLFLDMLGRLTDPVGLAFWVDLYANGTSAGQMANSIATSQEFVSIEVTRAYNELLRRAPDAEGLRFWTDAVMSGTVRPENLRGSLIASEEYYMRAGGTPESYVNVLYQDVLYRTAGPAEIAWWVGRTVAFGRASVAQGVWGSLEGTRARVDDAYHQYLGRSADPAGLISWAPVLQADGENALRAAIVDSVEYRNRALLAFAPAAG